jgi:uncharacterized protein YcgL (UPF0745 family)
MSQDNLQFTRSLIKGKIAEIIFQQMFLETNEFQVIPLGVEYVLPDLTQWKHEHHQSTFKKISDNLSSSPDFLLLSKNNSHIFLIEVKYRSRLDREDVKEIAENIHKHWDYAWLFLATPEEFFFQSCKEIIDNDGNIQPLDQIWKKISPETQQNYLQILKEFIK